MKHTILAGIAYTIWGLFSLLVCVYLTFPTGEAKDIVVAQIEAALGHQYRVTIDDFSLNGLSGVTIEGIRLFPTFSGGTSEDEEGQQVEEGPPVVAMMTNIDSASFTISLFDLVGGLIDASFEAEIGNGVLYGSLQTDSELPGGYLLDLSIDQLQLQDVGILSNVVGAPVAGTMGGHVPLRFQLLRFPQGTMFVPAGQSDEAWLQIDNLIWGSGPVAGGLFLNTNTSLGQLNLEATIDGDEIDLTLNSLGGLDLELESTGRISFPDTPGEELFIRINLRAGCTEDWNQANDNLTYAANAVINGACTDTQCAVTLNGSPGRLRATPFR